MIHFESWNTVAMIFPAEKKIAFAFSGWRMGVFPLLPCSFLFRNEVVDPDLITGHN
jgi:hypothetical protein